MALGATLSGQLIGLAHECINVYKIWEALVHRFIVALTNLNRLSLVLFRTNCIFISSLGHLTELFQQQPRLDLTQVFFVMLSEWPSKF